MIDSVLLADIGYLSTIYQLDLFAYSNIKIKIPMRENQHNYKRESYIFRNQENVLKLYTHNVVASL